MSKANRGSSGRTLGGKAYASMAKVEGLRLSKESAGRLERTKGMSPEKRRAEVLRAFGGLDGHVTRFVDGLVGGDQRRRALEAAHRRQHYL